MDEEEEGKGMGDWEMLENDNAVTLNIMKDSHDLDVASTFAEVVSIGRK